MIFTLLTLASSALVLASPAIEARGYKHSCVTTMTTKAGPCHTKYHDHYTPCTDTKTVTLTTTASPGVVTSTSTVFETSTSTSTVPTSSGFVDVQFSVTNSSYDGFGGTSPAGRRDVLDPRHSGRKSLWGKHGKKMYPHEVVCHNYKPSKKCKTHTIKTTSTVFPEPATTTVTTTSTIVVTATDTPIYEACSSENFADFVNRTLPIVAGAAVDPAAGDSVIETQDTTAYGCCVSAITNANSTVWAFGIVSGQIVCEIGLTQTCMGQTDDYYAITALPGQQQAVVGNANCGLFKGLPPTPPQSP